MDVHRDDEKGDDDTNCDDGNFMDDCVLYYSRQNDCLRTELTSLWNLKSSENGSSSYLFPRSFPWAEEAFFGKPVGVGPDAVNLWIGDERAVSAMHKDHYENLFYVLSGEKVFGLCPPSDVNSLYECEVIAGRFNIQNNNINDEHGNVDIDVGRIDKRPILQWTVELDRQLGEDDVLEGAKTMESRYSKVHWIATDVFGEKFDCKQRKYCDCKDEEEFPLLRNAHPMTVRVRAGELLYLPSLWFHRVTQTCETTAINYWFDMNFESPLWCYFHFLQQLQQAEGGERAGNTVQKKNG